MPGRRDAADAGKAVAAMRDQRVDERSGLVPGRRMHDQAGGLVDDQQVGILVDDLEGDDLAFRFGRQGRRHVDNDARACIELSIGIACRCIVDRDPAFENQRLQPRTRQTGNFPCEKPVQSLAFVLGPG